MDKKIIIVAIVVIALVIVVAGVYAFTNNDSKATDVTYNGNGGTTSEGEITFTSTSEVVQACMFANGDYVFDNWNTKTDGTGTTYANGESVVYGTLLYAQWTETYYVTSSTIAIVPLTLKFNGEIADTSGSLPAVLPTTVITLTGLTNWELSGDVFSCVYNGRASTLTTTVTGANNVTYTLVNDVPTITIETTNNIELSIFFIISR